MRHLLSDRSTKVSAASAQRGRLWPADHRRSVEPADVSLPYRSYWSEAREPLVCIVFLAPLMALYEMGVRWLENGDAALLRNGADLWMRDGLNRIGLGHPFLLPCLVVGLLLIWHVVRGSPWRFSADTLVGMTAESLLFALLLVTVGQLEGLLFEGLGLAPITLRALAAGLGTFPWPRFVSFVGAGVYEEVLFRLCLLPACYVVLRAVRLNRRAAWLTAIVASSLTFAAAHYVGPFADAWSAYSFAFRTTAGVYFAVVFLSRGLGVAVGCHVLYDILVGIVLPALGR